MKTKLLVSLLAALLIAASSHAMKRKIKKVQFNLTTIWDNTVWKEDGLNFSIRTTDENGEAVEIPKERTLRNWGFAPNNGFPSPEKTYFYTYLDEENLPYYRQGADIKSLRRIIKGTGDRETFRVGEYEPKKILAKDFVLLAEEFLDKKRSVDRAVQNVNGQQSYPEMYPVHNGSGLHEERIIIDPLLLLEFCDGDVWQFLRAFIVHLSSIHGWDEDFAAEIRGRFNQVLNPLPTVFQLGTTFDTLGNAYWESVVGIERNFVHRFREFLYYLDLNLRYSPEDTNEMERQAQEIPFIVWDNPRQYPLGHALSLQGQNIPESILMWVGKAPSQVESVSPSRDLVRLINVMPSDPNYPHAIDFRTKFHGRFSLHGSSPLPPSW